MKYLVVIANGLTDRPIAEKENKTPLQLADTPNLDRMVRDGCSGSVKTIPENFQAGNEISYLSLLGYDPEKYDIGPAYFDALAIGLNLKDGEIPLCCDFVTLQASHNDMVMKDYTAGHLSCEESKNYLNSLQSQISDCTVTFYPGLGHHNLMVMHGKPFTKPLTPPNELIGEGIRKFMPVDDEFKDLIYIINQAQIILHNHPINKKRKLENLDSANSIWLWGNGTKGTLPSFEKKYGKSGSLISASLLFQGMAKGAGMRVVKVEGATGFAETNFKNKVKDEAEKSGISKDEIENTTNTIDRADKEIKSLNTTIAGQMILDEQFYSLPKPIGEEITKWSGRNSGDEVFTFVSSVEELNSEIHAITRPLSEVVIHATETATDKDIGAIEINNIQSKLGHDGIGYHYVIRRDGRLQRGRPPDRVGDHTSANGHNNHSLGIVLVGGINVATGDVDALGNRSSSSFTREQYTTLERFLEAFYIKYPGGNVFGHNDLDAEETDPYFDVQEYVETVFRKQLNGIGDPLNEGPVDPTKDLLNIVLKILQVPK